MVNLQKLKNKVSKTVSKLSPDKLAEIYFMDRKRYIKEAWYGDPKKAKEILRKNNQLYEDKYLKDMDLFHKSHHKYLDWFGDYHWFMDFQDLIANAKREQHLRENDLTIFKSILQLLILYQESKNENSLKKLIESVEIVVNKRDEELSEYPMIIEGLESQIEKNQIFKDHDFFQDVDPLGYKDFSWEEFMDVKCNMASGKPRNIQ